MGQKANRLQILSKLYPCIDITDYSHFNFYKSHSIVKAGGSAGSY